MDNRNEMAWPDCQILLRAVNARRFQDQPWRPLNLRLGYLKSSILIVYDLRAFVACGAAAGDCYGWMT